MSCKNPFNLTIKDIAKLSGVSKSTVSRVINHDPNVSSSTRESVLSIIQKYHFTPSKSAQVMRGYSNKVIGVIVTRLDSASENQALRKMLPCFYDSGFDAIIVESQFSSDLVKEHLTLLKNRRVDGVVIFAFTHLDINLLHEWQSQAVILARSYPNFASVCYDDSGAVQQLLKYFYHQGHRRMAYIGVELNDHTTGYLRHHAYCTFCAEHNLSVYTCLGELNHHTGYQYAKNALSCQPTVIVCATDSIAVGVNKYLQEFHINSIAVASIGNSALLRFLFPGTVSAELGFPEAGYLAANELLEMLQKRKKPQSHLIPSTLVSINKGT